MLATVSIRRTEMKDAMSKPGVVAHTFNTSIKEVEVGGAP